VIVFEPFYENDGSNRDPVERRSGATLQVLPVDRVTGTAFPQPTLFLD
jgi:hypothetical protein